MLDFFFDEGSIKGYMVHLYNGCSIAHFFKIKTVLIFVLEYLKKIGA
jgi:hypothetical protein